MQTTCPTEKDILVVFFLEMYLQNFGIYKNTVCASVLHLNCNTSAVKCYRTRACIIYIWQERGEIELRTVYFENEQNYMILLYFFTYPVQIKGAAVPPLNPLLHFLFHFFFPPTSSVWCCQSEMSTALICALRNLSTQR